MLQLDDPQRPLPRALLDARGGFAWWYVDALDADGNGIVCIWSWGLPFLPGDRAARRAGDPPRTGSRPSLNVAVYKDGHPAFYSLHTVPEQEASWEGDTWRFGDATMRLDRTEAQATMTLSLRLPVPGSDTRFEADLVVHGKPTAPRPDAPPELQHAWTPLMHGATLQGSVRFGDGTTLDLHAPAYVDRNGSHTPMDELGIAHWTWGRQQFGDILLVHYLTWPDNADSEPVWMAAQVGPDGTVTPHSVHPRLHGPKRTWLGMTWWRQVELEVDGDLLVVTYDPPVDSGPFYLRCMTTARWRGQTVRGWAELCVPDRIDLPQHRFIVKMAVHNAKGPNSMWLPLFVGPLHTRLQRLWAGWTASAGHGA